MSNEDIETVDDTDEEDIEEEETADDEAEETDDEEADDDTADEADDEGDEDDGDDDDTDLAKENARLRKLLQKKTKRRAIAKNAKGKKITTSNGNTPSVDDMFVVTANQLDQTEYEYAQKVAQLEDLDLAEAVASPLFKGWRRQHKEELKQEQAALGTSRGSGKAKKVKTFATVKKRDDHRTLWKKRVSGQS